MVDDTQRETDARENKTLWPWLMMIAALGIIVVVFLVVAVGAIATPARPTLTQAMPPTSPLPLPILPATPARTPTPTPTAVPQPEKMPIPLPSPVGMVPHLPATGNIPIRASYYTLEPIAGLSDADNVNCDDDCSHLALVRFDPAFYGRVAACPQAWLGLDKTARLTVAGLGSVYCLDTGPAIKLTYREVSGYGKKPQWVYEVDFLCRTEPEFHGTLFGSWEIEWIPLEEAVRAARTGTAIC